ncbi:hypothetical protein NQ318_017962 [Aromia moschata]|uniref:Uncharacterized protein n=1 Tax=Aromia moschata TaxID=1265417 RepID=A0AAV8Y423_9CUCU|nr:hypothetical protein NQ318_017962 [Aromia moschata]
MMNTENREVLQTITSCNNVVSKKSQNYKNFKPQMRGKGVNLNE